MNKTIPHDVIIQFYVYDHNSFILNYSINIFTNAIFILFQGLTLTHDPATSDDSGRASERLTSSSVAPRDADSSRDRLSDVSVKFIIILDYHDRNLSSS